MSNEQIAADISARIEQLSLLLTDSLKGEMAALKKALLENPAACLLLKSEDIGTLVLTLQKITGKALAQASEKKAKTKTEKATSVKLTAEQLQAALNSEDF